MVANDIVILLLCTFAPAEATIYAALSVYRTRVCTRQSVYVYLERIQAMIAW